MTTDKNLIYVVEDDDWYRELLAYHLETNPDNQVEKFPDAKSCLDKLHKGPGIVTLDYKLPDMEGAKVLKKIREYNPETEVIIISEQNDIETAVNLLKEGAYDYIAKADDIRDKLLNTINKIRENQSLKTRISTLQEEVEQKYDFEKTIIGQSPAIKRVFSMIEKAIKTNISVTVTGETGTGKELVAKAIHFNSKRSEHPFVPVNMAAIPSELIESELFGHEKGAFTGANQRRIGKFEEADKGSIFLDEIGEMDITFQAKLLRVLQEKEVVRIGSNKPVKIDARILVATNRNLLEEVKAGNFREDLYYRLFGLPIELPPLRDRGNDVMILAKHFLENFCKENGLEVLGFSPDARQRLLAYNYPGNIRELKSVVELAAVMNNGSEIQVEDITFSNFDPMANVVAEEMTMEEYKHRIVELFLNKYDNNIKLVAEKLDIGHSTIYRMLKEKK